MLADFFQLNPVVANQIHGTYNLSLVALSYLVAVCASYIALDLVTHLRNAKNEKYTGLLWLVGGAVALGFGIWAMHFIGVLSLQLPIQTQYNTHLTISSLLIPIGASLLALMLLKSKTITSYELILYGFLFGLGIAAMHYTGMEAMKNHLEIRYRPDLFFLSIIIAILASELAIIISLLSIQAKKENFFSMKIMSSLVMGMALCGTHYVAMFATIFTLRTNLVAASPNEYLIENFYHLASASTLVVLIIVAIAITLANYKKILFQIGTTRQAVQSEAVISILHNVGNIINSLKVSSDVLQDKVDNSNLPKLFLLCRMIKDQGADVSKFFTDDPKGKAIPEYLILLSETLKPEYETMRNELLMLKANIKHIEEIVSMQHDLQGKITAVLETVSLGDLIEHALLICGISTTDIDVKKNYPNDFKITIDKSNVLQIIVNLIKNAKEALQLESHADKKILIAIAKDEILSVVNISISDNGAGISKENLSKIFSAGFTTKTCGHGVGLHSSAASAKAMGGALMAQNNVDHKGATFILTLPLTSILSEEYENFI